MLLGYLLKTAQFSNVNRSYYPPLPSNLSRLLWATNVANLNGLFLGAVFSAQSTEPVRIRLNEASVRSVANLTRDCAGQHVTGDFGVLTNLYSHLKLKSVHNLPLQSSTVRR
jgi:hypothetical protein